MNCREINVLMTFATFGLGVALAGTAHGQDALGRGDALDANTQVGSGGRNAPVRQEDFRLRNLIVTGDVAGGRGFRGSVGYAAEGDFRDSLGSDDLFQFRADSAFSSPDYIQMGLSNDRLRFGHDIGIAEFHRSFSSAQPQIGPRRIESDLIESRRRLDLIGQEAFSGQMLDASLQPTPLGVLARSQDELYVAYASPLQGLQLTPWQRDLSRIGLSNYDVARLQDDLAAGRDLSRLGRPFEGRFGELVLEDQLREGMIDAGRQEARITQGPFENILRQIAERNMVFRDEPLQESELRSLDERFAELRRGLIGESGSDEEDQMPDPLGGLRDRGDDDDERDSTDRQPDAAPGDGTVTDPTDPLSRGNDVLNRPRNRDAMGVDADQTAPFIPDGDEIDDLTRPELEAFAELLRHGQRIEDLSTEARDRFNELMKEAQASLRAGEYLQAERRFNRALRLVPNHPMASAGLINAQIGAGLYAVAGLNLRQTFARYPQMIDTRYEPSLFPARAEIDKAIDVIGDRMVRSDERPHQALLLAYIGRQIDDEQVMRRGLGELPSGDALATLVRAVWTGDSLEDVLRAPDAGRAPLPPAQSDPEK